MSILNLNNWFNSFIPKNKRSKTLEDNDIIAFGRKNEKSFNKYTPVGITAKDLKEDVLANVPAPTPDPNVPIKTYCAEILQLGIGTTPQVNAVIVNTFDGTVAPAALLPLPSENGFIRIDSSSNEFTIGKTMVTVTPSETNADGVNCFVSNITDARVSILCQDIANSLADKNNVQILVKIEVYA